jgi:hypothetical protein
MTIFGPRATPRYVLRGDDAEADASAFAASQDWDPLSRTVADPDRGVEYEISWLTQGSVTFHYQEDDVLREGFVYLAGEDAALIGRIESDLVGALDHWTADDLLAEVDRQPEGPGRGRAILRSGLGAPIEPDRRFVDLIIETMRSGEPPIRAIGIRACAYSPVPQYRPELDRIARTDDEAEVRELAQATLRAFDEFRIDQP